MIITPNLIVSLFTFVATVVVGFILAAKIKSQKATIDGLKTLADTMKMLNEMYDFEKMKSYAEIVEKEAEGKFKYFFGNKFKEELSKIDKEAKVSATERFINKNADLIDKYEEFASDMVNFLLTKTEPERIEFLKKYPKNRDVMIGFLKAVDNGEVQQGSTSDSVDPKSKNS